ncbi:Outer membrane porin protein OmpD precursor [Vibrio quintilis]|uniref:Outer membrane porin protein OmpD n=2 Tax=Vibrio quintilis TaxID=1117707 RepID=A0A1M7YXP0_9VIBR|nr:Outer membrane porin protein OmpD precursor [Vibrio quintilis]
MKKTLLALAVLTAAGTVNAAEIYSSDATAVKLKGEIDAYLANYDIDQTGEADADINAWGKIQIDAETALNDDYKVAGSFEIESGSGYTETKNEAKFDDMYLALKADKWGVAIGETGDFADSDDAIEKTDITNEGNLLGTSGHPVESSGHGFAYKVTPTDGLTFVADVNTQKADNVDNIYGLSLDYSKDIFSVGASYIGGEIAEDTDFSQAGLSASVDVSGLFLAATYSNFEGVNSFGFFSSTPYYSGDAFEVAASYTADKLRLYTVYGLIALDEATKGGADADGDVYSWTLGVDYAVASNLTIFAEYTTGETSDDFSGGANLDADATVLGAYYTF